MIPAFGCGWNVRGGWWEATGGKPHPNWVKKDSVFHEACKKKWDSQGGLPVRRSIKTREKRRKRKGRSKKVPD